MLLNFGELKVKLEEEKKRITIRVTEEELRTKLESKIEDMTGPYKDYEIKLELINREKVGKIEGVTILDKMYKYSGQFVKTMGLLVELEEKTSRDGKWYIYNMMFQVPGMHKLFRAKIFNMKPLDIWKKGSYFLLNGKIELEDSKYYKQNEVMLGVEKYTLKIDSASKIDYEEEKVEYSACRSELHAHTMFSKNDAFITVGDVKRAIESNKLRSLAITDHGVALAFNDFAKGLKGYKDKFKLILGMEAYASDFDKYKDEMMVTYEQKHHFIEVESNRRIEEKEAVIAEKDAASKALTKEKAKCKAVEKRKVVTAEELQEATMKWVELDEEQKLLKEEVKALREEVKAIKTEVEREEKNLQYYLNESKKPTDQERDHLIILLKSKDEEIDYRGEKLTINPGLVALYKLISESNIEDFSAPTINKQWGRRPIINYKKILNPEIRKHFILGGACVFGRAKKLACQGKWTEYREWVKNLDYVEIQPRHNDIFMIGHEDFPDVASDKDISKLNREMYRVAKEEGVRVVVASDGHLMDRDQRDYRSWFSKGYFGAIFKRTGDVKAQLGLEADTTIDKQPYILSLEEYCEELAAQGFTQDEAAEILGNTEAIADECISAFDITLLPKKLFIPDFPGIDVKTEVPKLAWEFAIEKWSKDGTKEGIEPKIRGRMEKELEATAKKGFEVLYYVAYWMCRKSEELGYIVGSRGSAGSMLLTYCLGVGENNVLEPHYYCPECHEIEWVTTKLVGLDMPDKQCKCGATMEGDGLNIESHNFTGFTLDKVPDIDLNFSNNVQVDIHNLIMEKFGLAHSCKAGTLMTYGEDALKKNVFLHIPNVKERVANEEFDVEYMARKLGCLTSTGQHPGGVLIMPQDAPFEYVMPLQMASDDPKKRIITSSVEYHSINFGGTI